MTGMLEFFADEARTQPITQSRLAAVSQGPDELFFTRFMPHRVFFTASWEGNEVGQQQLTVGIFKLVAGTARFCLSEEVQGTIERSGSRSSWPGFLQIRDVPWGPGRYQLRVFLADSRLAEGVISLVD